MTVEEKAIQKLSKYGDLITCKLVHPEVVTIVVGSGFDEGVRNTFAFMQDCIMCFPDHPILETCVTKKDFAMLVLKTNLGNK